jgi:16S rRNA (cytidine1402-2'-O)-methyltransferase
MGDRTVVVGRELTKLHEEIYRGTLGAAAAYFTGRTVKGEVAVMVGQAPRRTRDTTEDEGQADAGLMAYRLVQDGVPPREAARQVATQLRVSSREVYNRLVKLRGEGAT